MPEKKTLERAKEDLNEGKSASTAAGEFVREEMHHIRKGKHGARSTEQAIAIGLSKARRAGVPLEPPAAGQASDATRHQAEREYERGKTEKGEREPSRKRSRAAERALQREPHRAATKLTLSRHAKTTPRHSHASPSRNH